MQKLELSFNPLKRVFFSATTITGSLKTYPVLFQSAKARLLLCDKNPKTVLVIARCFNPQECVFFSAKYTLLRYLLWLRRFNPLKRVFFSATHPNRLHESQFPRFNPLERVFFSATKAFGLKVLQRIVFQSAKARLLLCDSDGGDITVLYGLFQSAKARLLLCDFMSCIRDWQRFMCFNPLESASSVFEKIAKSTKLAKSTRATTGGG